LGVVTAVLVAVIVGNNFNFVSGNSVWTFVYTLIAEGVVVLLGMTIWELRSSQK